MKTLKRYLLGALSFCLIGLGTSHAQVSQVTWSNIEDNNGAGENFLSDAFGARLLPGNLVMIGSFDIPDATIQANSGNINYLLGHFAQYGSTTISGNGVGTPGLFYQNTIASSNNTTPFPVNGQQIYIWAFNSSLATTATQQGIFSQSALSNWIFPTDNTISNTTSVDLSSSPRGTDWPSNTDSRRSTPRRRNDSDCCGQRSIP